MAPECVNEAPYAKPADVWALGCVLFDLCARRPAFSAFDLPGTLAKIRSGRAPLLPQRYSPELRALARSMLYTDEARRPTAEEVLRAPALAKAKAHVDARYGPELPPGAAAAPYSETRAAPEVRRLLARYREASAGGGASTGAGAVAPRPHQRRTTLAEGESGTLATDPPAENASGSTCKAGPAGGKAAHNRPRTAR